jgi:hypothetical protein
MTDYRAVLQRLVQAYVDHGGGWPQEHADAMHEALKAARTALAQPMPTVDELDNKSRFNYMVEDQSGITLDGLFSRQDLLELGYSKPPEDLR